MFFYILRAMFLGGVMKLNNFSTGAALFAVTLSLFYGFVEEEKIEVKVVSSSEERMFAEAVVTVEAETLFPLSDFDAANSSIPETNFVVPMEEPEVVLPEIAVYYGWDDETVETEVISETEESEDFFAEAEFEEEIEDEVEDEVEEEIEDGVNPDDVYRAFFEAYGISPANTVPAPSFETVDEVPESAAPSIETVVEVPEPAPSVETQEVQPEYYYQSQDGSYIDPALIDEAYLAGLIKTEAGGVANQNGKIGVGLTVLSRMQADAYPDDMHAVIDQKSQYATPSRHYSESDLEAARAAVALWNGENNDVLPEDVMYFFGDGKENYFYRINSGGGVEFFPVPGQTLPDNIYELYRQIVLKR